MRGALKQGIPTKTNVFKLLNKRKPDYIKFPKFLIFNGVSVYASNYQITAPTVNK